MARLKTCPSCKEKYQPVRSIQPTCDKFECKLKYAQTVAAKSASNRAKRERKEHMEAKANIKTRQQWLKEAQSAFNKWIRHRDKLAGHPCISSGKPLDWSGNNVDAGHYRSTGSAPHLRFVEENCHAQSKHDNRYMSGNVVDYRIGLIARIGLEAVEALEADQTPRKYTIDDLKAIKQEYTRRLKDNA